MNCQDNKKVFRSPIEELPFRPGAKNISEEEYAPSTATHIAICNNKMSNRDDEARCSNQNPSQPNAQMEGIAAYVNASHMLYTEALNPNTYHITGSTTTDGYSHHDETFCPSKISSSSPQYNADCEDASHCSSSDFDDYSDDTNTYYSDSTSKSFEDDSQCSSSIDDINEPPHEPLSAQHQQMAFELDRNNTHSLPFISPKKKSRDYDNTIKKNTNNNTARRSGTVEHKYLSQSQSSADVVHNINKREDISKKKYTISFAYKSGIKHDSPERPLPFEEKIDTHEARFSSTHRYEQHQARLKRNYLDAFAFHDDKVNNKKHAPKESLKKPFLDQNHQMLPPNILSGVEQDVRVSNKLLTNSSTEEPLILLFGPDTMAQILDFLTPAECLDLLTMPLSKKWRDTFTVPQDIWKILCLSDPFYVKITHKTECVTAMKKKDSDSEVSSTASFPRILPGFNVKHIFGRYRLLYTSFVKCVKYLDQIMEDSRQGKTPRGLEPNQAPAFKHNNSHATNHHHVAGGECLSIIDDSTGTRVHEKALKSKKPPGQQQQQQPKYSHSKLTERLLGPTKHSKRAGPVGLPWSCAIYSVVNWMVAFIDVLGIQILCLKVLPCLLEDESQRTIAQRACLTDIVLKGMVIFPDSVKLHTTAFHTLVLLARPLGGKEGMLFHRIMVGDSNTRTQPNNTNTCKNGIAVMLDSMRRFRSNESLQAMSMWSMVNIALIASQKTMLVKLDGISVVANGMIAHPHSSEVQFRALFALINLVIPCSSSSSTAVSAGEIGESSEKEILDESVGQIANLVVVAMKIFCSSEAIMNRACLVLHNLSLNDEYHRTLLWTPNCYQMLEWAMGNYRFDQVLQQSAGGTLQRLQRTLRNDRDLHVRFSASIRANQQHQRELPEIGTAAEQQERQVYTNNNSHDTTYYSQRR